MKTFLAKYMLFIYLNFIKDEDKDIYKNWAKPLIKGTLFVSSIYIWILSIIFFPFILYYMVNEGKIKKSKKDYQKILNIYK